MSQAVQRMVQGFAGENRLLPDGLLPATISPDALNTDYSRATLKKRAGYAKLHAHAILEGGVRVTNSTEARCVLIPDHSDYEFAGDCTIELFVTFLTAPTGTNVTVYTNWNEADEGSRIYYNAATTTWYWDTEFNGAAVTCTNVTDVVAGVRYHVTARLTGTTITLDIDGTTGSGETVVAGLTTARDIYLGAADGATPGDQVCDIVVDELRVWSRYRTDAELVAATKCELHSGQLVDADLVGYWRMNDARWNMVQDLSPNKNHGHLYESGPGFEPGLVPNQTERGYAIRFDGYDDAASAAYNATFAPILDTGDTWTVEAWVRLDNPNHDTDVTILHLGSTTTGNGAVFWLYLNAADHNLYYKYSTTTTDSNEAVDTTYDAVPGVAFHVAIVRNGTSIYTYINGELVDTETVAAENGPTSATTYGMYFGAESQAGSYQAASYAPVTIDEVRVWTTSRSQKQVQNWDNRLYPDAKDSALVGYWRFDADDPLADETYDAASTYSTGTVSVQTGGNFVIGTGTTFTAAMVGRHISIGGGPEYRVSTYISATLILIDSRYAKPSTSGATYVIYDRTLVLKTDGDKPGWAHGLVYPQAAPPMLLCAPLAKPQRADAVRSGKNPFHKEIVVSTHTDLWSLAGTNAQRLIALDTPAESSPFDWCHFQNKLIITNGIEDNRKYDASEQPQTVSIPEPGAALTATPTGAGGGWPADVGCPADGTFSYVYAYRNSKDGTESLYGPVATAAMVGATHDTCALTGITVSTNAQVDQIRIYRLDAGSSVYHYLADVANTGTPTYSDTGRDVSNNAILETSYPPARGHAEPHRYCAVFGNKLFLANSANTPSGLIFSQADFEGEFPVTNIELVDPGDGDEITGIIAAFGGLVIFKQYSIHYMSGYNSETFNVRKIITGHGCVSARTIAESPEGVYFLSHGGVYLLDKELNIQAVSLNQQDLFLTMDPELFRLACGVYDPIRRLYLVSVDIAEQGTGSYYDLQPGLFSNYYTLATSGGDSTGNNDATPSGGPVHVTDAQRGACVRYDGVDAYHGAGDMEYATAMDFTLGAWIRYTGDIVATWCSICELWDVGGNNVRAYVRFLPALGVLNITVDGTPGSFLAGASTGFSVDEWFHMVVTKDTFGLTIYINGEQRRRSGFAGYEIGAATGTPTLYFGDDPGDTREPFPGDMQNVFYVKGTALEPWQVKELHDYEALFGQSWRDRITMVYDETAKSWAKWDCAFDCLLSAEHTTNRAELLGAARGFVYRLFEGHTDGSTILRGGALPTSGIVTANSTNAITDADAVFPTEGHGLAGCPVIVKSSEDSTRQERTILANTATALYLDRRLSPAITGTYYVAPIDWYWESPWMEMHEDLTGLVQQFSELWVWQREVTATHAIRVMYKTEQNETWLTTSFTCADEFNKFVINNRGRKLKVRFENYGPNQEVEIEGFQTVFEPQEYV